MADNENIYSMAEKIIQDRRFEAVQKSKLRKAEIESKIPEISELNRYLSGISLRLMAIFSSGDNVEEKIEKEKKSSIQAKEMIEQQLVMHGYPKDYLEIPYVCSLCSDTGTYNGKRCECFINTVNNLFINNLNKNAQVNLSSFDTFRLSYYEKYQDAMRGVYNYCVRYAENFNPRTSKSILMYGKTGLGKTHLSLAIANEVIAKGYSVVYDSAMNFLRQIENEHFGRDSSGKDTLEIILSADLLIMDDLGAEYDSKFYVSAMYNIINTRINRSLPVIISTNLTTEQIEAKYEARITSRIFAEYDSLKFVGNDIRFIKKKNNMKSDSMHDDNL